MAAATRACVARRDAVAELLRDRGDLLVVSGLGSPSYDVFAAGDHDGNMYLWGAMGAAALVGLGVALAQPARPVAVITGDGEQLMGLGGLATIAVQKPSNYTLIVLDNGRYGETGMQRSHTDLGIDLHRIAAAAGFAAVELSDLSAVRDYRPHLSRLTGGPRFATVRISPEETPRALPPRDGVFLKHRFRNHLGLPVR
jgi:thiamine pyrophosphate-dependent acetolactate synthase large subunit-like protein